MYLKKKTQYSKQKLENNKKSYNQQKIQKMDGVKTYEYGCKTYCFL